MGPPATTTTSRASPREFPGEDAFAGQVIHPQHWPEDLDYKGKKVVVIGSGATAVTLVPALAESGAGHVTMLQRSPTYILSLPARDGVAQRLRKVLPEKLATPRPGGRTSASRPRSSSSAGAGRG